MYLPVVMSQWVEGVTVQVKQGRTGLYYGVSDDMRGLLVAGLTPDQVLEHAAVAIEQLREALLHRVPTT